MYVTDLTPAFLNAAIGQLYGKFPEKKITSKLSILGMDPEDAFLLEQVVKRAREYFKNPDRVKNARKKMME